MATPRIFVSSTCYDLQEIRFQLRNFINDFGYDSVMSEFDDIFYSYGTHVQDSCLDEIPKCQLFVLVIGNNYGSFYHQDNQHGKTPDSVTLKEFQKALEIKIHKHIFINKYVDYDYKNYKRALDKVVLKYYQNNNVQDETNNETRLKIKKDFDDTYHFPYESYKYIFYFLDIIHDLSEGNAINTFDSFADIKDSLRKQWAGFMYESLTRKDKIGISILQPLESKIDHIEKSISRLLEAKEINNNKLTFDLSNLTRDTNIENLEKLQNQIKQLLTNIYYSEVFNPDGEDYLVQRIYFNKKFDETATKKWLENLQMLTQIYKWSKSIHVENVFKGSPLSKFSRQSNEVNYKTIFELYTIYNSLSEADQNSFVNTVCQVLNKNYEKPVEKKNIPETIDDLPF